MTVFHKYPTNYQFRLARNSDQSAVQSLIFSILREYGLKPDPELTDRDLFDLEGTYFQNQGLFEVCEHRGEIVGTWGLYPLGDRTVELRKMYLSKNHRGQGLGRSMVERAIAEATNRGFKVIRLETASALKEAVGLYKSLGFQLLPQKPHVERCDQAFELTLG